MNTEIDNFEAKISQALRVEASSTTPELAEKIIMAIEKRARRTDLAKMIVYSLSAVFSLAIFVITWRSESQYIFNSETGSLASLLFSDTGVVLAYWREYLLSVVESLPVFSITALVLLFWLLLSSLWLSLSNYLNFIHHAIKRT